MALPEWNKEMMQAREARERLREQMIEKLKN
jgi:hypothetical protein